MPTINCGDKSWNNLDALILDANSATFYKEEATVWRHVIGALASAGELRFPKKLVDAELNFVTMHDPITDEYIIKGIK